ncbi:MAG: membrane protein insertase YidC [Crocinitomicaceae bacterium]
MDKRSLLGLLIIGVILFAFSFFNANEVAEEVEAANNSTSDSTEQKEEIVTDSSSSDTLAVASEDPMMHIIPKVNEEGKQFTDSFGTPLFVDTLSGRDTAIVGFTTPQTAANEPKNDALEEIISIENDLLRADISNKGGRVVGVYLKEYKSYEAFLNEKDEPLQLFDDQSSFGITFYDGDKKKNSADYDFKFVKSTANSAVVEMINPAGQRVIYSYALREGHYDMDFDISFKGFSDRDAQDLTLESDFKLLSTEKHLPSEQRVSTVFFKYSDDDYDYLSEAGDDEEVLESNTEWVAYKQSYFSSIWMSETGFKPSKDSEIKIRRLDESDTTYIKQYISALNLGVSNVNNTVEIQWYLGPNDYEILATYENGSEDIINLGWGLFRWINVYFMRPLFNWLMGWGLGAGLAILLLTIFVKLLLSPVNYKMYKSSAMMKVLRPEMDALRKKYPKKEDGMKKQQELMALYKETGVSPMAGCVPMLIQMPILFAIFRLFPAELSLRQKGFLWAEDLSTYDAIVQLGFDIPFYGSHISLFTLLMAGTTLLYTHYNSSNMQQPTMEGMPNMKYIMYFFPIMMIFFFNSYSSGLSYYYFISTLMTIGIMFAIKKFLLDEEKIHAKIAANRANPKKKKGKSKFQQRLEEAQRLQQERASKKK